jgi:hypothetical protein
MSFPFTNKVWNKVEGMIGLKNVWILRRHSRDDAIINMLKLELEMEGFARFGGAPNLEGGPTKRGPI